MRLVINGQGDEADVFPPSSIQGRYTQPQKEDVDWREAFSEFRRRQEWREKTDPSFKTEIGVETPCHDWYGVVFMGDMHMFAEGFDSEVFDRDIALILDTPNLGIITNGDDTDNFTWNPGAFEQLMNPHEQVQAAAGLYEELMDRNKLLARVGGNHTDEWLLKNAGLDYGDIVYRMNKEVPQLREGGIIHHWIGSAYNRYLIRHRTRYNSSLNMQHGNRRAFEREATADVVISGHTHDLGTAEEWLPVDGKARETHLVKNGSYKSFDRYASGKGMSSSGVGASVLLVNGADGMKLALTSIPKATYVLNKLNGF